MPSSSSTCRAVWRARTRVPGYEADEIIGQPITCFYLPEDLKANLPTKLLETARVQGRVEVEGCGCVKTAVLSGPTS